jgi:8-oxo-dGTP pyrophosphatase MutT (NUDIX family)
MNTADKVCPIVFRDVSMRQILAFEHPRAGVQLVKGYIEPGETVRAAALRELAEESGIADFGVMPECRPGTVLTTAGRRVRSRLPSAPGRWRR